MKINYKKLEKDFGFVKEQTDLLLSAIDNVITQEHELQGLTANELNNAPDFFPLTVKSGAWEVTVKTGSFACYLYKKLTGEAHPFVDDYKQFKPMPRERASKGDSFTLLQAAEKFCIWYATSSGKIANTQAVFEDVSDYDIQYRYAELKHSYDDPSDTVKIAIFCLKTELLRRKVCVPSKIYRSGGYGIYTPGPTRLQWECEA